MRKEGGEDADALPVPKQHVAAVFHVDRVALNLRNILADTYTQYKLSWLDTKEHLYSNTAYKVLFIEFNPAYALHCSCKLKRGVLQEPVF